MARKRLGITKKCVALCATLRVLLFPASLLALALSIASAVYLTKIAVGARGLLAQLAVPKQQQGNVRILEAASYYSIIAGGLSLVSTAIVGYTRGNPRIKKHLYGLLAIDSLNVLLSLVAWTFFLAAWSGRPCMPLKRQSRSVRFEDDIDRLVRQIDAACQINAVASTLNAIQWGLWTGVCLLTVALLSICKQCEKNALRAKLAAEACRMADARLLAMQKAKREMTEVRPAAMLNHA
jgi:hypothetical protein